MTLRMLRNVAMMSGSARAYKHSTRLAPPVPLARPDFVTDPETGYVTVDIKLDDFLLECVRHGKFQKHWKTCHHCLAGG